MESKKYRLLFYIILFLFIINMLIIISINKSNEKQINKYNQFKLKHIDELKDKNKKIIYSKECGYEIIDKRLPVVCGHIIINQTKKWEMKNLLNLYIKNYTN